MAVADDVRERFIGGAMSPSWRRIGPSALDRVEGKTIQACAADKAPVAKADVEAIKLPS